MADYLHIFNLTKECLISNTKLIIRKDPGKRHSLPGTARSFLQDERCEEELEMIIYDSYWNFFFLQAMEKRSKREHNVSQWKLFVLLIHDSFTIYSGKGKKSTRCLFVCGSFISKVCVSVCVCGGGGIGNCPKNHTIYLCHLSSTKAQWGRWVRRS